MICFQGRNIIYVQIKWGQGWNQRQPANFFCGRAVKTIYYLLDFLEIKLSQQERRLVVVLGHHRFGVAAILA